MKRWTETPLGIGAHIAVTDLLRRGAPSLAVPATLAAKYPGWGLIRDETSSLLPRKIIVRETGQLTCYFAYFTYRAFRILCSVSLFDRNSAIGI